MHLTDFPTLDQSNGLIKEWELYTLLDHGFKWGFTVYNISTALLTWLTAAGHVVVNRGEDVRLPRGRQQFSVKRVGGTNKLRPESKLLLLCQVECMNAKKPPE